MCMVDSLSKASFRSLGSKQILSFFLIMWFGEWWLPVYFSTITYEFTQSVCSLTSSRIPSFTRDSISSSSRWIGTFLGAFLGACHASLCSGLKWNLYRSPGKHPIPSKHWNIVTECLASSMGFCSQKSFHCVGAWPFSRLTIHLVCKPELSTCRHVHNVPVVPYMKLLDVHALDLPVLLPLYQS